MSLDAVKILGINITISSKKEILEYLQKFLLQNSKSNIQHPKSAGKPLVIVTPNPEQIVYARGDSHFRQIMNQADVALPDGGGIVWASKLLKSQVSSLKSQTIQERIPGVELMEDLVAIAAKQGVPIALIGGRGNLAIEAFECLKIKYPGLDGVAIAVPLIRVLGWELKIDRHNNPNEYFHNLVRTIVQKGVKIVFVGLGAPKQELFIEQLVHIMSFRPMSRNPGKQTWIPGQARDDKKRVIFMSVGGSFDIITNRTPRAPEWVRSLRVPLFSGLIGSEFIWRLFREPWRLGRQLALLKFTWLVVWERLILK